MQTAVMGEMKMDTDTEPDPVRPAVTDSRGVLKQNRQFLDYFWDIAKPERETRLRAVERLIEHVKKGEQSDELKYTLKRLIDGLCHAREEARTGYSLALAQVLSVFEEITLRSMLDQIREKHNLQTASKKQIKYVTFGNFFGVLALSQSTRLHKETDVLLECVKLLQSLSQYREYLRDLPRKTMADILNEVSEQMFEQVLFGALQEDLSSALSSPEQLELLLLVMRRFSSTLSPAHLDKMLGTTSIINTHTLPRLVEVMKTAARSVKKECVLPAVASDLLHVSLREDSFMFFWDKVVIDELISDPPGPSHYLAFRLMGVSLPLLSVSQLQYVLSGEVMRRYGEHVMTAQLPERFKFSPEMDECVSVFLRSCSDVEKQLLVLQAFTQLTHRGAPVVSSFWKVLEHVELSALKAYTHWLKESFCHPQTLELLEFSTRKQRRSQDAAQDSAPQTEDCVPRLRKWIIPRLACIVENHQVKKDEELVTEIARFIFFHAFFDTVKSTAEIPETQRKLSPPLDPNTRNMAGSTFFSVLHSLSVLPLLGESVQTEAASRRSVLGVMADGSMWVHGLVRFANILLQHTKHVRSAHTLSADHTHAWDSMLQSVEALSKKMKKSAAPEHSAFQHLFLIIGIQMFKAPDDSVELLNDLRCCMEQAQAKKSKKKKQKKSDADSEGAEPHWVEVVVEILLSLLAQPSRLIRSVCKTAFSRVCPYLTQPALTAILNVLDPGKDEEESGVLVMDDNDGEKKKKKKETQDEEEEDEEDDEQEAEDEDESDSSDNEDDEDDDDDEEEEVDQNFRLDLIKVLQGQNALAAEEEDGSEDEELDDEAMMKLDENLASLFGEQKKKVQAKKDEKERLRKEKTLVRDFKIKVLDLLDVFLCKQGSSVLVLGLVEPLLSVIENCMSSESGQHEQDFLRRAAHIFRNQLCRGKHYCREVEGREAELHDMLERLIGRAQKLSESSVALYYFSAALYLVKVLRGVMTDTDSKHTAERVMGKMDVARVTSCFRDALSSFMTRRKTPLTGDMFIELFNRFPVLCANLLDTAVENITGGVREHQQGQACVLVLRALQCKEVKQLMADAQWTEVCQKTTERLTRTLQKAECKNKAVYEKTVKVLELARFLIRAVHNQKLEVKLEDLQNVLRSMNADGSLQKSGKLEDTYWSVMKLFGLQKPKVEKVKNAREEEQEEEEEPKKKKKGFLPESKKRKNRKKPVVLEGQDTADTLTPGGGGGVGEGKKKRRNNKKKRSESESQNQPPAKKTKAQLPQSNEEQKPKQKKKKNKKRKKKSGERSSAE
ncbi:myb-binding protein 1A-like protein isoform X2 [Ictalurus punctatus]|uniref:Myb-binding protein 1A-like protein isoform X2 n=1 Tax=Ictalurus punctatus TaxID=7998 RepID=A0A2D0PKQ6_ICTPU|nr:myb-binding protein 1A-like protein isoform X2 [Ictalurus punctatus]